MTYHIFGDTGGHHDAFYEGLKKVGVDPDKGIVPNGDTVVCIGDFIHKGSKSAENLRLVDRLLRNSGGRFISLIGNHEMLHFSGVDTTAKPGVKVYCRCTDEDLEILFKLLHDGFLRYSFAFWSDNKQYLLTHAGLTEGFWKANTDMSTDAISVSTQLNKLPLETMNKLSYLKLGEHLTDASPVWAVCDSEVAQSWVISDHEMPFNQVHGHTTIVNWDDKSMYTWIKEHPEMLDRAVLNYVDRVQTINVDGKQIIGVDPTYWYEDLPEGTVQPVFSLSSSL